MRSFDRWRPIGLLATTAWVLFLTTPAEAEEPIRPLRWGVDDAGSLYHLDKHAWGGDLFKEFGFNFWVMHYVPRKSVADNIAYVRRVDAWCDRRGIDWVANLEAANWLKTHLDEKGRDWYNRPDGRHYFQFPDDVLAELGRCKRLVGLMYDEAAHMQNCANMIAKVHKPFMYDPAGQRLEDAAEGFTRAAAMIAEHHQTVGLRLCTEHVFPVLFHNYARAGYVAATKILKENWSPAYIACAMGAAIEYGTDLWITPDLWGGLGYPGHSVEEYRSALLLAYHMGADCIYTENLAYDHEKKGKGSLVLASPAGYKVTEYGKISRWFIHEYVPAHPRSYSFRDLRPRVAIVRQPDACWGQGTSWLPDTLFGCKRWPSNDRTEAWLRIWHLLTRGVIAADGLSWHARGYAGRPYQVFCPLDGVVVFDHLVEEKHLRDVEVIFVTGLGISAQTLGAVERCVSAGATCVGFADLLPERVRKVAGVRGVIKDGKGLWVTTRDFLSPHVRKHIRHVLPDYDKIRYRFGEETVTFRLIDGDPNRLSVKIGGGD